MEHEATNDWIEAAGHVEPPEQWALLCFLAGRSLDVDASELHAALRRAELLLAAGGDPRRRLELYGRAVTALAEDLDDPALRAQLTARLTELASTVELPPAVAGSLRVLGSDGALAWQCFAMALLADDLADDVW